MVLLLVWFGIPHAAAVKWWLEQKYVRWLYLRVSALAGELEPQWSLSFFMWSLHETNLDFFTYCWIVRAKLQRVSTVYIMFANIPWTKFSQRGPRLESIWEGLHKVWPSRGVVHWKHPNKSLPHPVSKPQLSGKHLHLDVTLLAWT